MKRWLSSAAIVAGIIVSAGPAAAAPPDPVDVTFTNTDCGFPVEIHVVGKTKTIDHGGGRFIVPAPGQKATLTANGKTVKYVVTGTFTWTCQMVNRHDAGHRLSANKYVLRENRRNFLSAFHREAAIGVGPGDAVRISGQVSRYRDLPYNRQFQLCRCCGWE
jgi:hypothetical protein